MQAASEMYRNLHSPVKGVFQAMENHPSVKAVKQQLEYLLSHRLLKTVPAKAGSSEADSAGVDSEEHKLEAVSAQWWTVGVAMELLRKLNTIPAYLSTTVHRATVNSASQVISTLRAVLDEIHSKTHAKNTNFAGKQGHDESAPAVVNVGASSAHDVEAHAEHSAVTNAEVCTEPVESSRVGNAASAEGTRESISVGAEENSSPRTVPEDSSATQQQTEAQSSTWHDGEASIADARQRSNTFYSLFRRSKTAKPLRDS